MIFDKIDNRSFYMEDADLAQILEFLGCFKPENYPAERVVLDGDNLYVNPVQLVTRPESECLFEAHQHYADVHFIVEGQEKIVVQASSSIQITEPYSPEKDCMFGTSEGGTLSVIRMMRTKSPSLPKSLAR